MVCPAEFWPWCDDKCPLPNRCILDLILRICLLKIGGEDCYQPPFPRPCRGGSFVHWIQHLLKLSLPIFSANFAPNMYLFRLNVSTLICFFFLLFFSCNFQGSTIGSGSGWIELILIEAKDLVSADLRGTSDPYVRAHYGNLKKRTKV